MYELPSTKNIIQYLHICAAFPTKPMWIKAIKGRNFASWSHLTMEAVYKHFPESDEIHQGYMRGVKQGVRSTKNKKYPTTLTLKDGTTFNIQLTKHNLIFV